MSWLEEGDVEGEGEATQEKAHKVQTIEPGHREEEKIKKIKSNRKEKKNNPEQLLTQSNKRKQER